MSVRFAFQFTIFLSLLVFETATYQGARAAALNVNPCTLVTNAELEQIVGKLKSGPKLGSSFGSEDKACKYVFETTLHMLILRVYPTEKWDMAEEIFQDKKNVAGLGEEAFLHRNLTLGTELWIKEGGVILQLSLKSAAAEEKLKPLAKKALGRF
jgi:hypothetical protein